MFGLTDRKGRGLDILIKLTVTVALLAIVNGLAWVFAPISAGAGLDFWSGRPRKAFYRKGDAPSFLVWWYRVGVAVASVSVAWFAFWR